MSIPAMTPGQWKQLLGLPFACLHTDIQKLFKSHRPIVEAWANGVDVEMKMGQDPDCAWYGIKKDKMSFPPMTDFRIAPTLVIKAEITTKQAQALRKVLEESSFHTENGQAARNSIIRSIDVELMKAGL